jgi:hypothetical protein
VLGANGFALLREGDARLSLQYRGRAKRRSKA